MFLLRLAKILNGINENNIKQVAHIEQLKLNQGRFIGNFNYSQNCDLIINDLKLAEFKIFSQWGDDGIIDFLTKYLDITNKSFIEFGVENYTECNTRFLLMNENWSGLIMDGSKKNIDSVKKEDISWKYDLKAIDSFVTAENINDLIESNGFIGEIGLLHIDIDGNDYWVWKAINVINPIIVIIEYNSIFGYNHPWTIPYDKDFIRSDKHYSNLYYGTSLLSICDLANSRGYQFVGCNSNGNNAYFIRNDKIKDLKIQSPETGYVLSKFSESRDQHGFLTYLRKDSRLNLLKGMPVYNTRTDLIEEIK